jgi:hypothetical protein
LYFISAAVPFAIVNKPPPTLKIVISTRRMINRIRAEDIAGAIVDSRALGEIAIPPACMRLEVDSESGLGSRAFNSRSSDRSVKEPSLPPTVFGGDVSERHGTPAMRRGRPAPSATTEEIAVSLRAVNDIERDSWLVSRGIVEEDERDGRCRNGKRKASRLKGRDGRSLRFRIRRRRDTAPVTLIVAKRTHVGGTNHFRGE